MRGMIPFLLMATWNYYLPHFVLFGVFCAAMVPVLYYYQRRNTNPRCRPGLGEMTMVAVFALALGGAGAFAIGNIFRGEDAFKKWGDRPHEGSGPNVEEDETTRDDDRDEDGRSKDRDRQ